MPIIRYAWAVLGPGSKSSTLFECRDCGVSRFSPMDACPSCGSTDVVEFSFE